MKKDEVVLEAARLVDILTGALDALGWMPLSDDGRLYYEAIEGENRWAQRISRPGVWPHVAGKPGQLATPGLRYEVWYFQQRQEIWMALLCSRFSTAHAVSQALTSQWKDWVEGGKFARRYHALNDVWKRSYPATDGIWRVAPKGEKLETTLLTLARDTLPALQRAMEILPESGNVADAFAQAAQNRKPLQELVAHFPTSSRKK